MGLLRDGFKLWITSWSGIDFEGIYVAKCADAVKQIRIDYYGVDTDGFNDQLHIDEKQLTADEPAYVEYGKTIMLIDLYNEAVDKALVDSDYENGDKIVWFED